MFTNNNAGTVTETASVTASDTFSGNVPYNNSSAYYAYVKAGTATTFSSAVYSDTNKDAWAESLVFTVAAGSSASQTAHSARKNWDYINAVWTYSYTANNCYTWTSAPQGTNSYTMECWGAQGGNAVSSDDAQYLGKGGYVKGIIMLSALHALYICIGGEGTTLSADEPVYSEGIVDNTGGYNGGGNTSGNGCGGGGATDIRISQTGGIASETSLRTRIMVAGGGGGMSYWKTRGGAGSAGGLIGPQYHSSTVITSTSDYVFNTGGTQTSAGISIQSGSGDQGEYGSFGKGGAGYFGGGGGGWYGGSGGSNQPQKISSDGGTGGEIAGGGGSSFISGHAGCNAVNPSTGAHLGPSTTMTIDDVEYRFTSTKMIDGNGKEWTTASQTTGGNTVGVPTKPATTNDGYARITLTRW